MSDPLSLTNREIVKLHEALVALDGLPDRDGTVIRFKFDTKTIAALAKNRVIVERASEFYQRGRKTLGAQLGVVDRMKLSENNAASVATFIHETENLLDESHSLEGLVKVALADLLKHDNQIPPGVIANLMPLIAE